MFFQCFQRRAHALGELEVWLTSAHSAVETRQPSVYKTGGWMDGELGVAQIQSQLHWHFGRNEFVFLLNFFWMTRGSSAGLTRSLGEWSRLLSWVLAVLTLWFIDSAEGNWGWEIRYICPITVPPTWSLVNACAHKHTHPHSISFYTEIIWSHCNTDPSLFWLFYPEPNNGSMSRSQCCERGKGVTCSTPESEYCVKFTLCARQCDANIII